MISFMLDCRTEYVLRNKAHIVDPCSVVKRGLNVLANGIDSCQPARTAQADMGRNFSLFLNFCMSKDKSTSIFNELFDKMDFMDP